MRNRSSCEFARSPRVDVFLEGLQAIDWTVDERGLAGLSDLEGILWTLPTRITSPGRMFSNAARHSGMEGSRSWIRFERARTMTIAILPDEMFC